MKQFCKNQEGHFVCEECGRAFKQLSNLSAHINKMHYSKKEYFDKWIKDSFDNICKICNNETKFINMGLGYRETCSKDCHNQLIVYRFKSNKTKILEKRINTCLKKYGVVNVFQNHDIKEKNKILHLNNYGVENPSQSKIIKKRKEKTSLINYGVKHPMQNIEVFEKTQKTRFIRMQYKDTNLWYQGNYELDFLEHFFEKIDIERGPVIKFMFNNKNKVYFSDFYIPSLNLVVEIKNSYLYKKYKEDIKRKERSTISNVFKYILILDKDYSEFIKFSARF